MFHQIYGGHFAVEYTHVCCLCGFQDGKAAKAPEFSGLTYTDAGLYMCEVSLGGLKKQQSFELVVEGQ